MEKDKRRKITKKDLKEYTVEEIMTEAYGKKGTPKRDAAEKRIQKLMNTKTK